MQPHSHDESHFTVVLKGSYDEVIDGETTRHRVGSMLYYPAGHAHAQWFGDTEARGLMFTPPESCLDLLAEHGFARDRATHVEAGSVSSMVQRLLAAARYDDPFTDLTMGGLFLELIGSFGRAKVVDSAPTAPKWLVQVHELLREESSALWTNEELARRAGRHPVHLAKAFRRHYGRTIGDFQRHLRLKKALPMIAKTNVSLLDISLECGYSSQAHFSRSFKSAFGITPSEYRSSPSDLNG